MEVGLIIPCVSSLMFITNKMHILLLLRFGGYGRKSFTGFFDKVRYKCNGILQYGCVFGQGFVPTGGIGKPLVLCCHYLSNVFNANAFG